MAEPLEDFVPPAVHDLAITCFELNGTIPQVRMIEHRVVTISEFDEQLAMVSTEELFVVIVDEILLEEDEEVHWGSFFLAVNGQRAWIHLTAGPCFIGRDPNTNDAVANTTIRFLLDNGEWCEVNAKNTVMRQQGILALRHWVETEGKLPSLEWNRR